MTDVTPAFRRALRERFPALAAGTVFLENAGGSQVPHVVAERIRDYMLTSYVQLGAGYPLSRESTRLVDEAHAFVGRLMNAGDGYVILGSSTSSLLRMLADCYAEVLPPGREIVVAENGHEANVGPWVRLETLGHRIRWWPLDPESYSCSLQNLIPLLNENTALVAFPHVSNLLGRVEDVRALTDAAHRAGARVVVDGVAYAPHRAIDAAGWGVDWYAYSTYKVYGPHMGALFGSREAVAELTGPNHFFIPREEIPYKFELGGASHEGCAGILALGDYLAFLAGEEGVEADRGTIERAFDVMAACEAPLTARLVTWLRERPGVRLVGPVTTGDERVGTVSFVHASKSSAEIAAAVDASGVAIRHGHMYAYRLCRALGLDPEDGVVRVSLVHYNTPEEIERLLEVLGGVL